MRLISAGALALVLMVAGAPALRAQEPDQDKEKQKQQEEEKKKKKQPDEKEKPPVKPDDKAKPERERAKPDARASQENNSQQGKTANARRIPNDRYRAGFGQEHHFRIARRGGQRFEYGGFAFEFVEAWPSGWSDDDEYYIVLDGDDYYLVDVRHPELHIRVIIVG